MKSIRYLILISFFAVLIACEKDNYFVPADVVINPNVPVSLSSDIQPIFDASCATSGCHDGQNDDPNLTPGNAWQGLFDTGDIDTLNAENSKLYKRIAGISGNLMPPASSGGALPAGQVALILNWIKQGAKNN
ncbi:MAG TPA: hypothetical protein PLU53_03585 [Bacteroidia bacterium]|nr:hypothetical protein [Bacteroidia bacterium]